MAMAMMKYREDTVGCDPEHMIQAQQLMRVPLDLLLAKEQTRTQWIVTIVSVSIAALSLVVAIVSLFNSANPA